MPGSAGLIARSCQNPASTTQKSTVGMRSVTLPNGRGRAGIDPHTALTPSPEQQRRSHVAEQLHLQVAGLGRQLHGEDGRARHLALDLRPARRENP